MSSPADSRYRLYRLMKVHDRSKVAQVEKVLQKFEGKEEQLMSDSVKRYGPEPEPEPVGDRIYRYVVAYDEANADSLVPKLMSEYKGREMDCIAHLRSKYGPEPAPPTPRATPVPQADQRPAGGGSPAGGEIQRQKDRLRRYYQHYVPEKVSNVDANVEKYAKMEGGFDLMWDTLEKKYGKESAIPNKQQQSPPPQQQQQQPQPASPGGNNSNSIQSQKDRLRRFYQHYAPDKVSAVDANVEKYAQSQGGFALMWQTLEGKYGREADIPNNQSQQSQQQQQQQPASQQQQAQQPGPQSPSMGQGPQPASSPPPASSDMGGNMKERLVRFYAHYVPEKTEADVENALKKYGEVENGYMMMWRSLEQKYGPESAVPGYRPPADGPGSENNPAAQKERLVRFYAKYAPDKTEADINQAIEKYGSAEGGYARMWESLERKYGPEPGKEGQPVGTAWMGPVDREHKARLEKFYSKYAPNKTEDEINTALRKYSSAEGGYTAMWATLEKKYGPEPKPEQSSSDDPSQKMRLRNFYRHYAPEKTEADINMALSKYATAPGGFPQMWKTLEAKYGPEAAVKVPSADDAVPAPKRPVLDLPSVGAPADLVEEELSKPRSLVTENTKLGSMMHPNTSGGSAAAFGSYGSANIVHLVVKLFGADYSRYDKAPTDKRHKFREAIEIDVAKNIGIPVRQVRLTKLSAGSINAELDAELPSGEDPAELSAALVGKVQAGSFIVASIRDCYRKELGGNPVQLYVQTVSVLGQPGSREFQAPIQKPKPITRSSASFNNPPPKSASSFPGMTNTSRSFGAASGIGAYGSPPPAMPGRQVSGYGAPPPPVPVTQLGNTYNASHPSQPRTVWNDSGSPQTRGFPNAASSPYNSGSGIGGSPFPPNQNQSSPGSTFGIHAAGASPPRGGSPARSRQGPAFQPQGSVVWDRHLAETTGGPGTSGFLGGLWQGSNDVTAEEPKPVDAQQWRATAAPYSRDAWSQGQRRTNTNPYAPSIAPPSFHDDHPRNPAFSHPRDLGDGYGYGAAVPTPVLGSRFGASPSRSSSPGRGPPPVTGYGATSPSPYQQPSAPHAASYGGAYRGSGTPPASGRDHQYLMDIVSSLSNRR